MSRVHDQPTGFAITGVVQTSSRAVVYRGIRNADRQPVVLKVLIPQHRPQDVERLKNEYAIGRMLDLPTVGKVLSLETYRGLPALVMEDFGGESLDHWLGAPMEIGRFLRLAVDIAGAVAEIHHRGIVHKDLKPENILVHPVTGEVKIADFGIATAFSSRQASSVNLIEGSLPYLAPEQSGRMNRVIDERSDLYSLGVTFYQLLTAQLPFQASDPLEWVHCHIAKLPIAPAEILSSVPAVLSACVMKLLAKEPDDRYQSARGLEHDLERCLEEWNTHGSITLFPLGELDVSERLRVPQKLYGREKELATLLGAFEHVVISGTPELVLVSGYSGIGKSSLVQELHQPIVRARGIFGSGKVDQYKRNIPYASIVQACTELVLEILARSEAQIAEWRERLREALGVNAQLIVDVIPPIELIIGWQSPVPELPPAEAQNRFRIVFRQFIGVFAAREHPLTLFLDDLQWADSASLELLMDLLTHPEMGHLLIIGAYRDNEVFPTHPLILMLSRARSAGAPISEVVLGPLSSKHLRALVSDTLRCPPEEAAALADLLQKKTAGNPFFTIQFLSLLHDEHLIEFDASAGVWRADVERIRRKGYTDNVVELMVGKLERCTSSTLAALKQLACFGSSVDSVAVSIILDRPEERLHADLLEAVRDGLLFRLGDDYEFLHDRIQEAAYSLIPERDRAASHLRIGRRLLSRLTKAATEERVFEVVNQLNRGVAIIDDPRERETLLGLNFLAGKKAKAAIAYSSARMYLTVATTLLPEDAFRTRYEETFAVYLERSECEYLDSNFECAEELFNVMLVNARSDPDRARVYRLRISLYQISGYYDQAVNVGLEALQLFGVTFPSSEEESLPTLEAESRALSDRLRGRRIADLADMPVVTDDRVRAIIGLLVDLLSCAYTARPWIHPLLALRALDFSLRFGNTKESCFAYCAYGVLLVSLFEDIPSGFEFSEMCVRLNEKFNDRKLRGAVLFVHGLFINSWRRPIATSLQILAEAFRASLDVGDLLYATFNCLLTPWQLVEKGDSLDDVIAGSQKYVVVAKQARNENLHQALRIYQQLAATLKGATEAPPHLDDATFDEAECLANFVKADYGYGVSLYHIAKQLASFTYGEYSDALASATQAASTLVAVRAMLFEVSHYFYYALTLTALYPAAPEVTQQEYRRALSEMVRKLKLWADNCPANYQCRYALVAAEVAHLDGDELAAMRHYDEAISSAAESGFVQVEALANELAAKFYRARGFARVAETYQRDARACYVRWGAEGKVRQLDRQYPQFRERRALTPSGTFALRAEQIDVLSIVKASQAVSGEILLDRLLHRLVQVVIELAGAQKGFVILCREGRQTIEAAAEALIEERGQVGVKLLDSQPVTDSSLLPASIVHFVARTKQKVVLEDASAMSRFSADEYIVRVKPKSVLCLPIVRLTELIGMIYLENNLVAGAFTVDHLALLELLASQAAISLDNAHLHRQTLEALRMRDEFLAVASHELRTPMTSLLFALEWMRRWVEPASSEDVGRHVEVALRQGKRLRKLIGDLFDLSWIEGGMLPLSPEECELSALVHEAGDRLSYELSLARCSLSVRADAPVVGRWDRSRLDQVITNLLSNAMKFGAGHPIEVAISKGEETARLAVKDQGIGISPAHQADIFKRFGRAVSLRQYGGLGLGLYICRRIVEAHGGTIQISSQEGKGATFIVDLPLRTGGEIARSRDDRARKMP